MPSLFDKLWTGHAIAETPGGAAIVAIDRVFLHERTGTAALNSLAAAGRTVADPARAFAAMDPIVDTFPGRGAATTMPGGTAKTSTPARWSGSDSAILTALGMHAAEIARLRVSGAVA